MPNYPKIYNTPLTNQATLEGLPLSTSASFAAQSALQMNSARAVYDQLGMGREGPNGLGRVIGLDEARGLYQQNGLNPDDFNVEGDISIIDAGNEIYRIQQRQMRQRVMAMAADGSFGTWAVQMGTDFMMGFLDPVNYVVGGKAVTSARAIKGAGTSLTKRAAARSRMAVRDSLAVGALQQPLIAQQADDFGEDYTLADAAINIAADAVVSVTLTAGGSFASDALSIKANGQLSIPDTSTPKDRMLAKRRLMRSRRENRAQKRFFGAKYEQILEVASQADKNGSHGGIEDLMGPEFIRRRVEAAKDLRRLEAAGFLTRDEVTRVHEKINDPSQRYRVDMETGQVRLMDSNKDTSRANEIAVGMTDRWARRLVNAGPDEAKDILENHLERITDLQVESFSDLMTLQGKGQVESLSDMVARKGAVAELDILLAGKKLRRKDIKGALRDAQREAFSEGYIRQPRGNKSAQRDDAFLRKLNEDVLDAPVYSAKWKAMNASVIDRHIKHRMEVERIEQETITALQKEINEDPQGYIERLNAAHLEPDPQTTADYAGDMKEAAGGKVSEDLPSGFEKDVNQAVEYAASLGEKQRSAFQKIETQQAIDDTAIDAIMACRVRGS